MWNLQKTPQMSSRQPHKQIHKQDPSVRGKFRFRTRLPKADPRQVEFTENTTDVGQAIAPTKTQAGTLRPWESQIPGSCTKSRPPPCGIHRKPTDVGQATAPTQPQAGTLRPWEIQIPGSCTESRHPPCGIYENPTDVAQPLSPAKTHAGTLRP